MDECDKKRNEENSITDRVGVLKCHVNLTYRLVGINKVLYRTSVRTNIILTDTNR